MAHLQRRCCRTILHILAFAVWIHTAWSQDSLDAVPFLPDGVGISNQMKYSYDREKKLEIFEDWLNLDYRCRIFSAGLRFEVFEPNDPNPSISRGKERYADIAFKYVTVDAGSPAEGASLTVGNYYVLFGRGLILKSYEDRNIRVDNNLLGVKITGRYAGLSLTALTGRMENFKGQRADLLHAVDLEYMVLRRLTIGGTFASHQPDQVGAASTRMASLRIAPSVWNFDFYGEYGIKQNDDIREAAFGGGEGLVGRGVYVSGSLFLGSFSLSGEYKLYDNFGFRSSDLTADYSTPPALRRDYGYILLNRHPSPLNSDNEQGFQVEANLTPDDQMALNASYGWTSTLNADSYFQRSLRVNLPARTQLREVYASALKDWGRGFTTTMAMGYSEELSTDTKSLTPILEVGYALTDVRSVRLILEHQQVTDRRTTEQYYDDVLMLEFLQAPTWSFSVVGEMKTREPVLGQQERTFWIFAQLGIRVGDHTDGTILVGSRQAGNICIGGVCRYEPEFKGIELKLMSRF